MHAGGQDRVASAACPPIEKRGMFHAGSVGMYIVITWLVVGLVAGLLAGLIVGGYGVLADIVVGMIGAFIGGYLFQRMAWHAPFAGIAGTIFIAFIGAVILLLVLHLVHGAFAHTRAV